MCRLRIGLASAACGATLLAAVLLGTLLVPAPATLEAAAAVTLWLYRMKENWPAYRDAFFASYAKHRRMPDDQGRFLDLFIAARETAIALWIAATAHTNPGLGTDLEAELAPNAQAVERLLLTTA